MFTECTQSRAASKSLLQKLYEYLNYVVTNTIPLKESAFRGFLCEKERITPMFTKDDDKERLYQGTWSPVKNGRFV